MTESHSVYGLTQGGQLKYIGYSKDVPARCAAHKTSRTLDGDFECVILGRFGDRDHAMKVEATLIKTLHPPRNVTHNSSDRMPDAEAEAIWFSRPEESDRAVLEDMPGWAHWRALSEFGSRRDWRWSDPIRPLWTDKGRLEDEYPAFKHPSHLAR